MRLVSYLRRSSSSIASWCRAFGDGAVDPHDTRIIDGRAVARRIEAHVKRVIEDAVANGKRPPRLGFLMVGDRPDSSKYVALKKAAAARCGMETREVRLEASSETEDVVAAVRALDSDNIDGLLVQLPLPPHINTQRVLAAVSVDKDVDGKT